ncbi:MAG: polyprenyl synthetase family protein [Clostridia bacterium]|nr:polyprenyl synthetase family protein [Clostridia bacterium]
MNTFNIEYEKRKNIIENYIKEDIKEDNLPYKTLLSAMRYSVNAGGKRIRPVLMMSVYELFKSDYESILPFMAGIEYIHTYSLIHDDLPAMDNDDLRRGKPTCHKKYSEAMAILAGDALLNYSYEKMLSCTLPDTLKGARYILNCAGKDGMIGGQVIDIENENKKISEDLLNTLHSLKTGALLKASCALGAILAGEDDKTIELMAEFGSLIGMAFQIKDDILDKTGDAKDLGKPIGSDEKNNKTTYLTYKSIEECEDIIKNLTARADKILDRFEGKNHFLKDLINYLIVRNK